MRASTFKTNLFAILLASSCLVIALLPFHALMTVWAASNFGHYTLFRLWKEFIVLVVGLAVLGLIVSDKDMLKRITKNKLAWAIAAYVILDLILALVSYLRHDVSGKAVAYGLLDDIRFLAFFVITWVIAINTPRFALRWYPLIVYPAAIVIIFGLLQMFVLPANILVHFGYGAKTILPYETINHNAHYVRILSTLRGANPLGAYLILPVSALGVVLLRKRRSIWNWLEVLLLVAAGIVLVGSYSRAAWIGALLSLLMIGISKLNKNLIRRYKLPAIIGLSVLVILAAAAFLALNHNAKFQNIVFHTQTNSASPVSSDQAHLSALLQGFSEVFKKPLGTGPGTSGPASVYNRYSPASIPENYFLQVGEESGVVGLGLFLVINLIVFGLLWARRQSPFALVMAVSMVGITFVNLLSLAWTDDTLSYIWWGLAGVALSLPQTNELKLVNKADKLLRRLTKYGARAKSV